MSESHWTEQEQWLAEQGARIKGMRSLHSVSAIPMLPHVYKNDESLTAMQAHARIWEEPVYTVEIRGSTIKQWQAMDKRMNFITNSRDGSNTGWSDPGDFIREWREHRQLLDQNQMYREAWVEFQSIRALLGKTTNWP